MLTTHEDVRTASGREIAVWRSWEPDGPAGPVVVVVPGFGQRMRSAGALALMLARNAATVYRFDSLDAVGISDGEIRDYSVGALMESLSAAVAFVREREATARVVLVATSLAAVAAVQFAAADHDVDRIVLVLGVVDARRTLRQVLGTDLLAMPYADLPAEVVIERQRVDPRPIHREYGRVDWYDRRATVAALARIDVPVRNFVAASDDWVDVADVRAAFTAAGRTVAAEVVEVPLSGHALLRNPVALRATMLDVTRSALGMGAADPVSAPAFEEIVALRGGERDAEREHRARRVAAGH